MKNSLASALRSTALVAALLVLPALASATESADRAAALLALRGSVPVKNAGPYVEVGTFKIQVTAKLGEPAAKLADGTWLYPSYTVEESNAAGTLVVRFNQGHVSELSLVTPAVAMAMSAPGKAGDKMIVASSK